MAINQNRTQQVIMDIKRKIVTWEYPTNHQLVEEKLSDEYDASRSIIRQALTFLEAEDFVKKIPRRGFFVQQLQLQDVENLYEYRYALELQVVKGLSRKSLSENLYKELFITWSNISDADGLSSSDLAKMDEDFHTKLAKEYGNELIYKQLNNINERLFIFREIDFQQEGRLEDTKKEHLEIIKLIFAKDITQVELKLHENVFSGLGNVEASMMRLLAKSYLGKRD